MVRPSSERRQPMRAISSRKTRPIRTIPMCPAFNTMEARKAAMTKFRTQVMSNSRKRVYKDTLLGRRVYITGLFKCFKYHTDLKKYLMACGAHKVDDKNVSKDTNYVICGAPPFFTKNVDRFRDLCPRGRVFDEEGFMRFLEKRAAKPRRRRTSKATAGSSKAPGSSTAAGSSAVADDVDAAVPDVGDSIEPLVDETPPRRKRPMNVGDTIEACVQAAKKRCNAFVERFMEIGDADGRLDLTPDDRRTMRKTVVAAIRNALTDFAASAAASSSEDDDEGDGGRVVVTTSHDDEDDAEETAVHVRDGGGGGGGAAASPDHAGDDDADDGDEADISRVVVSGLDQDLEETAVHVRRGGGSGDAAGALSPDEPAGGTTSIEDEDLEDGEIVD